MANLLRGIDAGEIELRNSVCIVKPILQSDRLVFTAKDTHELATALWCLSKLHNKPLPWIKFTELKFHINCDLVGGGNYFVTPYWTVAYYRCLGRYQYRCTVIEDEYSPVKIGDKFPIRCVHLGSPDVSPPTIPVGFAIRCVDIVPLIEKFEVADKFINCDLETIGSLNGATFTRRQQVSLEECLKLAADFHTQLTIEACRI